MSKDKELKYIADKLEVITVFLFVIAVCQFFMCISTLT